MRAARTTFGGVLRRQGCSSTRRHIGTQCDRLNLQSTATTSSLRSSARCGALKPSAVRAQAASSFAATQGHLPGYPNSPYLTSLKESFFDSVRANQGDFTDSTGRPGAGIPTFRVMDGTGKLLEGVDEASLEVRRSEPQVTQMAKIDFYSLGDRSIKRKQSRFTKRCSCYLP